MKRPLIIVCFLFTIGMMLFQRCEKEGSNDPPKVDFFHSVIGKQVAFTALTKRAVSWNWDFGDGETSVLRDPVHVYKEGGVYDVKLTVTGNGATAETQHEVSLALSNHQMLTGGTKATEGKKWKISSSHSPYDRFALADEKFTTVQPLATGMLGSVGLGLGEVYDDEFIFKSDGTYIHAPKHGGSLSGLVYTTLNAKTIIKLTKVSQSFGLCYAAYTPEAGARFTLTEKKDLVVTTVSANGNTPAERTYKDVMTLNFTGTEFIGCMDFMRECIIDQITPEKMRLIMFICTTQKAYYDKPSYVGIMTFEAVK